MAYMCNGTEFISLYGDITELDVDGIVIASSPDLSMDAGIACKIRDTGGPTIEEDVDKHRGAPQGAVITTHCGTLEASHLFHCVILDEDKTASPEVLRSCVRDMFEKARELGATTLALPALGSAFKGLSPKVATDIIVSEAKAIVEQYTGAFKKIYFVVCDPTPYRYYKKALKKHCK
jgi:O-acetyl-ADP-ribose deacetylase (regulator of RNase III)